MKPENSKKPPKKTARAAKTPPAAKAKGKDRSTTEPQKIPPILLEGDAPSPPSGSGPGQRYALPHVPHLPSTQAKGEPGELPESYGTERLLLTARDPHWLYAHWDLSRAQQQRYNGLSRDRHLILRIFKEKIAGKPYNETHVHPESRNWFVNVGLGGTKFLGQLGYYQPDGKWVTVSSSPPTLTPPDAISDDLSASFETLPPDLEFEHLLRLVKTAVTENVPLIEAIQHLRASGFRGLPDTKAISSERWTETQQRALAEIVRMDAVRRIWMGSLEITEVIRRQLQQELFSAAASQFSLVSSWSGAVSSFSSPYGGVPRKKSFWFNVNAELIIYGATEPDAKVTIGGRKIALRPDGTFSYRFALPDGRYDLPAIATSADGTDSRSAELKFSRSTHYRGDVGKHPQDPKLKPPLAQHVT